MTYQVMLADDENDVLEVIQKKIDWNALGLEEPVKASNGVEALELAEKVQPDIVMTDIKMPYMDGLELARQLRQLYPDIRIIILSGFDEFEYAKEAVHLNAVEYLLKPIDSEYLTAVFRKITASLDQEHEERQNQKILQQYYQQSLPVLQENFFISLVQGRVPEEELEKYCKRLSDLPAWSLLYSCSLSYKFRKAAGRHAVHADGHEREKACGREDQFPLGSLTSSVF